VAAVTTFFGEGVPVPPATHRVTARVPVARGSWPSPRVLRRRRLAVVGAALGLVVVAAQAGDALGGAPLATPERRPAATWIEVTARPGDSLWSIVERAVPGADPRPRVDRLVAARRGAPLLPGEVIQVPR